MGLEVVTDERALPVPVAPLAGHGASLTDQVVDAVRESIRHGDLRPGRLYSAYQLADRLGVSRSPVREALLRLAEVGMVTLDRNRGFRVVLPGAREIAEIFHLRLLLEVPAVRRVAERHANEVVTQLRDELRLMHDAAGRHDERLFMQHDQRLHRLLLDASGNRRLVSVVDHLRDLTRLLGASTVDRSRSLADIAVEHEPILDAIASHDATVAAARMAEHVTHTGRLLVLQATTEAGGTPEDADRLWDEVVDDELVRGGIMGLPGD